MSDVLFEQLGSPPTGVDGLNLFSKPASWPDDEADWVFLYRAIPIAADHLDPIRHALQRGELEAAIIGGDGEPRAIPATRWNGRSGQLLLWHAHGEIAASQGYSIGYVDGPVFVSRASLERLAGNSGSVAAPAAPPSWVSPYMRLMLDIAAEQDLGADPPPPVSSLQAEIRQRWAGYGLGDYSEKLGSSMATMLRKPGARGKQPGKKWGDAKM